MHLLFLYSLSFNLISILYFIKRAELLFQVLFYLFKWR